MTTNKPEQLALVGRDELAAHHEGRLMLLLYKLTTWAATPEDRSIDWELEKLLADIRRDADALRALRNEDSIPF